MTARLFPDAPDPAPSPPFAVFRSNDPMECGAVAAALQEAGIPALVGEEARAAPIGTLRRLYGIDHVGWSGHAAPTLVLVDPEYRREAVDVARRFGRRAGRAPAVDAPVEGRGLGIPPRERALAWISLLVFLGLALVAVLSGCGTGAFRHDVEIAPFVPAAEAPRLAVRYAARTGAKGWRLALVVSVPATPPSPASPAPDDAAARPR